MKLLKHTADYRKHEQESVVTIGVFDGVHRGHREIITRCVEMASDRGLPSVVLTFERNPRELVCGEHPCMITEAGQKLDIIRELGADYTISVRFNRSFAAQSPGDFCRRVLAGDLGARAVCVGENFNFGARGAGDVDTLREQGSAIGFDVEEIPMVVVNSTQISSTMIRGLIGRGEVERVVTALGRPYAVAGKVTAGHSRGKRLGYPTANMSFKSDYCIPAEGVYAGRANLRGESYVCAVNIGSNPTFGDDEVAVEVYLLDFEDDIYSERLEVEFHHRLREEREFASEEELVEQIERDVRSTRSLM